MDRHRFKLKGLGPEPIGPASDSLIDNHNVRCYGYDIYFFDVVNEETQLILQQMLKTVISQYMVDNVEPLLDGDSLKNCITIHINSPGGYASSGLALYDYIKGVSQSVPIRCHVEGDCASAATLIFLAAPYRTMSDNSAFLIHQCSWGGIGQNRFMQDLAYNADRLMDKLVKIYLDETDIAKDKKTSEEKEESLRRLLERDIEFTKEECDKLGITREPQEEPSLSEESMKKLNAYAEKLFDEEQKAKKNTGKKPVKKTTEKSNKKEPKSKENTETKS